MQIPGNLSPVIHHIRFASSQLPWVSGHLFRESYKVVTEIHQCVYMVWLKSIHVQMIRVCFEVRLCKSALKWLWKWPSLETQLSQIFYEKYNPKLVEEAPFDGLMQSSKTLLWALKLLILYSVLTGIMIGT